MPAPFASAAARRHRVRDDRDEHRGVAEPDADGNAREAKHKKPHGKIPRPIIQINDQGYQGDDLADDAHDLRRAPLAGVLRHGAAAVGLLVARAAAHGWSVTAPAPGWGGLSGSGRASRDGAAILTVQVVLFSLTSGAASSVESSSLVDF